MFAACGDILCFYSCLLHCAALRVTSTQEVSMQSDLEFFKKDSFVTETVPNASNWVSRAGINVLFLCREPNCFRKHECIRKQEEWQPQQYSTAICKREPV